VFTLVSDEGPEVPPDDAVPSAVVARPEVILDVRRDLLVLRNRVMGFTVLLRSIAMRATSTISLCMSSDMSVYLITGVSLSSDISIFN
jgi:hypothetical protein